MRKFALIIFVFLLIVGAFLAGSLHNRRSESNTIRNARPVLEKSAANQGLEEDLSSMPHGTFKVSSEKQQMIGVQVKQIEKKEINHTIRLLGRVSPDENRTYRITASSELWIRKVYPPTTGSIVKKDEPLLAFYTINLFSATASYMYALNTMDRAREAKPENPAQIASVDSQIRQAVEALQNLGVSDVQIAKMARTRKIDELADVVAPATGFILSRNATLNQWLGSGTELYTIADLSHIWILADIYENEAHYFKPGVTALVTHPYQRKTYHATLGKVLPIFDPATRTLKLRFETENPDFTLRPDMFVDVQLPVTYPSAITVPSDAILDSGLRRTVFVDRGNGFFEPREVETGRKMGSLVEVTKGLDQGERIVVSGNFLIDSESKLEMAAMGMQGTLSKDPVCGMEVSRKKTEKTGKTISYLGKTYYFCSDGCKEEFEKEPGKYVKQ